MQWNLGNFDDKTQSITPVQDTSLQAAWGDDGVIVLPAGMYVWTVRGTDSGIT